MIIVVIRYTMYSTNTNPTKADKKCYVSQQPNGLMKATFLTTAPATTLNGYPIENQVYDLRLEVSVIFLIFILLSMMIIVVLCLQHFCKIVYKYTKSNLYIL